MRIQLTCLDELYRECNGSPLLHCQLSSTAVHVQKLVGAAIRLKKRGEEVCLSFPGQQQSQNVAGLHWITLNEFLQGGEGGQEGRGGLTSKACSNHGDRNGPNPSL